MKRRAAISVVTATFLFSGCAAADEPATSPVELLSGVETSETVETFEAETLDGQTITIRAGNGALSEFTNGVPTEFHNLQLLADAGSCDEILWSAAVWKNKVDDSADGRTASAYANHAYNIHGLLQCPPPPPATDPPPLPPELAPSRFDTCEDAIGADGGDYVQGVDVEYDWYQDGDSDGIVCEISDWYDQ